MVYVFLVLMFGTGIPLMYILGVCVFASISLTDRHLLLRRSRMPVRYGPGLPNMLLGG